jgi:hypothetical protein
MRLDIGGKRYVLALETAAMPSARPHQAPPSGRALCGRAQWSLYREGLIIDVKKSGDVH